MITVEEVKTRKQQKEFLNFPLDLYKGNPYYIPPMYMDEKKIFRKDYVYNVSCDAVFFNAYKDGKIAGRVQGIIQKDANAKNGEKRARFTRIEAIDDPSRHLWMPQRAGPGRRAWIPSRGPSATQTLRRKASS